MDEPIMRSRTSTRIFIKRSVPVLILFILAIPAGSAGQLAFNGVYQVEDGEDDIVYVVFPSTTYRKGEQIEDIDILWVEGYLENGWMNFTLVVKGDIRTEDVYDYHISGDLDPYDDRDIEFSIDLELGAASIFFYKNYTALNLDDFTTIKGGVMNVSVPFDDPGYSTLFYLKASTYFFDQGRFRSYMDDTEPIEVGAKEENYRVYQILGLIILIVGITAIFYILFSKNKFRMLPVGGKKKCPDCGVIFPRSVKWCPYCEIPLD